MVLGAVESTGGVSVDPALPIENVSGTIDSVVAGYGQIFGLFGRSAGLALALPYVDAQVQGDVGEVTHNVTRTGFGDLRLRFTLGLLGSPALSPREFVRRTPHPALGASLVVVAPTGEYFPDKLINIGANRWSFRPEIGVIWPLRKWYLELSGGVWLFGDNDDFFGGVVREAGSPHELPGECQLHVPAAPLALGGLDPLHRRANYGRLSTQVRLARQ